MTLTITKRIEFDAGHRVPTHEGKCRAPHGHRYTVEVRCEGEVQADDAGAEAAMLADFGFLKDLLVRCCDVPFDHGFVAWTGDRDLDGLEELSFTHGWKFVRVPWIPTAENFASHFAAVLGPLIDAHGVGLRLIEVTVWETPTSTARWSA